jgi:hypothetical protein
LYKYLFLDIDGTLNSSDFFQKFADNQGRTIISTRIDEALDPEAIERLNIITNLTGAKIVVSSTWRIDWENNFPGLVALLQSHGITGEIIGATTTRGSNRGKQIQEWLDQHTGGVESFIILDDDSPRFPPLEDKLIKTTFAHGLQDEHMWKAIEMLGRKNHDT